MCFTFRKVKCLNFILTDRVSVYVSNAAYGEQAEYKDLSAVGLHAAGRKGCWSMAGH